MLYVFAPVVIITTIYCQQYWLSTRADQSHCRQSFDFSFSCSSRSIFLLFSFVVDQVMMNCCSSLSLTLFIFLFLFLSLLSPVAHRYNAIVHPLRKRMTKQRAFVHIFIIWFGATLFAVPTLIFSRTLVVRMPHETLKDRTTERAICILKWPDGYPWQSRLDFL